MEWWLPSLLRLIGAQKCNFYLSLRVSDKLKRKRKEMRSIQYLPRYLTIHVYAYGQKDYLLFVSIRS